MGTKSRFLVFQTIWGDMLSLFLRRGMDAQAFNVRCAAQIASCMYAMQLSGCCATRISLKRQHNEFGLRCKLNADWCLLIAYLTPQRVPAGGIPARVPAPAAECPESVHAPAAVAHQQERLRC